MEIPQMLSDNKVNTDTLQIVKESS